MSFGGGLEVEIHGVRSAAEVDQVRPDVPIEGVANGGVVVRIAEERFRDDGCFDQSEAVVMVLAGWGRVVLIRAMGTVACIWAMALSIVQGRSMSGLPFGHFFEKDGAADPRHANGQERRKSDVEDFAVHLEGPLCLPMGLLYHKDKLNR